MAHSPNRKSGLFTVFLTVLIDLLGFGIIIPLLPVYSQAYGASEVQLGILFASFSAMQFLFAPLWGRLSDRIGRKPVLVGGLFGTAIAYAIFGMADSYTGLLVARLLAGFFGANISTAQAYIADVTEEKDRAKGMGLIGAAFGLGFTFGPLIGGVLTESIGLSAPGYFAAAFSGLAAIFGLLRLKEPAKRQVAPRRFDGALLKRLFSDTRVRTVLLLYFVGILAFSAFETMFIRFGLAKFPGVFYDTDTPNVDPTLDQLIQAAPVAGYYLCFIGLISAVIQGGLIRRLVPRFGEVKLIIAGPILLGISLAIVGLAPTWSVVILGCLFMPFGIGFNNPSLQSLLSRSVGDDVQGATLGVNQSLSSLARTAGPLLAGASFTRFGPESPLLLAAGLLFGAAVLAYWFSRKYGDQFAVSGRSGTSAGESAGEGSTSGDEATT